MTTADPAAGTRVDSTAASASILQRIDAALERWSERLNPILVKEARQALKSRQFLLTFSLALLASWAWSVGGIALQAGAVYYGAGGSFMFIVYFIILAIPLLVVVPFSAFRSLAAEREEGTFELLSITSLSARQIVMGKVGSALLQIIVYCSALAPCIVFTYLLRGLDIVSLLLVLVYTILASVLLSVQALLMATITRSTQWQVLLSVSLILELLFVGYSWCIFVGMVMLREQLPFDMTNFWLINLALLTGYLSYLVLFVEAATAQISFASENRSTRLRIVLLGQQLLLVGWLVYFWAQIKEVELIVGLMGVSAVHWALAGALLTGEVAELSPRVRRALPTTLLGRLLFTWFNPGSGTGYVFAVCNLVAVVVVSLLALSVLPEGIRLLRQEEWLYFVALAPSYVIAYLGAGRLLILAVRLVRHVGVYAGFLLQIVLALMGTLGPFVVQMIFSKYLGYDYTLLQATNWVWTLERVVDYRPSLATLPLLNVPIVVVLVPLAAGLIFLLNLVFAAREVAQVRQATPRRVLEDQMSKAPVPVMDDNPPRNPFED